MISQKPLLNANLIKKYHQDLVFNYSEYPTKDHWNFDFGDQSYKDALLDWLPKNSDKKIFFYVHIPFCEQLCWFCTCSKFITNDYGKVTDYLSYLYKEIDHLFAYFNNKGIKLNVGTVFFGGGSPTILNKKDLKELVDKLKGLFDWSNVEHFTVEADPRRLDEERLIYNHEICGANRISFGMQDMNPDVQRRVNRIQPVELFDKILTDKVRKIYKEIAFDLLIGQPGQTLETMSKTCDEILRLRPTLVQLSLMAYKPWVAKYQVQMLAEGPLPDFLERKELLALIHEKLKAGGYIRTGFECYSLPDSPMTKAFEEGEAHYGAAGHQTGGRVNFIAVGSSSMSNLGNEYYAQNFYDLDSYKRALDANNLPIFRGMKLSQDDKIRQHITQQIRSYFKIDFENLHEQFGINAKEYFKEELLFLDGAVSDGLLTISDSGILLTEIGRDFTQNLMNVFDKYDPPNKPYKDRLATIKIAKELQGKVQEELR
jgi:oxygen-independent coproporphyrinogen-3 oxidase